MSVRGPDNQLPNLDLHLVPGREDECWPWNGELSPKGYGIVYAKENRKWRRRKAHRAAYERARGPIPPGLLVLHSCNNTRCCNPAHLRVGTHADNAKDRMANGFVPFQQKLTEKDARVIRILRGQGKTWQELADRFNVSRSTIEDIVTHMKWRTVRR